MLAAEPATDPSRDDSDLGHRLAELFGDALLNVMHGLTGGVERDTPSRVDIRDASVRFQVDVVLGLGLPYAFDDHIAITKRALDVTFFDRAFEHDIAVPPLRTV